MVRRRLRPLPWCRHNSVATCGRPRAWSPEAVDESASCVSLQPAALLVKYLPPCRGITRNSLSIRGYGRGPASAAYSPPVYIRLLRLDRPGTGGVAVVACDGTGATHISAGRTLLPLGCHVSTNRPYMESHLSCLSWRFGERNAPLGRASGCANVECIAAVGSF